jgi:16S rRNA (uracil1498-N3)-methyltransferase
MRKYSDKRFEDMNKRFTDMQIATNQRFEEINNKFYIVMALLIVIMGYLMKERQIIKKEVLEDVKEEINKKEAYLTLEEKILKPNKPLKFFHLGWCIIEPKNIEKTLPSLNEIGVSKISFFYCEYSQRNFRLKQERLDKIIINSSQQCGRSNKLEIEILGSLEEFIKKYKNFIALDFNAPKIECKSYNLPFIIGPEGGFSKKEKEMFKQKVSLDGFILKSETAAFSVSAKVLL